MITTNSHRLILSVKDFDTFSWEIKSINNDKSLIKFEKSIDEMEAFNNYLNNKLRLLKQLKNEKKFWKSLSKKSLEKFKEKLSEYSKDIPFDDKIFTVNDILYSYMFIINNANFYNINLEEIKSNSNIEMDYIVDDTEIYLYFKSVEDASVIIQETIYKKYIKPTFNIKPIFQ